HVRTGQRRGSEIEVYVSRDEQIQKAVVVVIGPRGARAPSTGAHTGLFGEIGERAVAVVAKKNITAVEGEIEVGKAVVVVVAHGDALAPAASTDTGLPGDVAERPVAVAVIQVGMFGIGRGRGQRSAVREEQIEDAVVVVIE